MAIVVVDSSVVIKWLISEPYSIEARRLLNDYQAGTLTFLAPDLLSAEIGNIIWKKQRFQGMAAADAQLLLDTFRTLTFTLSRRSRGSTSSVRVTSPSSLRTPCVLVALATDAGTVPNLKFPYARPTTAC